MALDFKMIQIIIKVTLFDQKVKILLDYHIKWNLY